MKSDIEKQFILLFHEDMQRYFINIEQSMISLLRVYLTIFALIGPAIAFLRIRYSVGLNIISLLLGIIGILGVYILGMYLELRIRKIKVLEQIALIVDKITKSSFLQKGWISMIASIEECPPYLRRPSSEWYTVIFLSFLNGISLSISILILIMITPTWFSICMFIAVWLVLFLTQFIWATRYAYTFDVKRELKYKVENKYDLLKPLPYFPGPFKIFDKIASYIEIKFKSWYVEKSK